MDTWSSAVTPRSGKIALLITEDWFALSHFQPLIALLKQMAPSVVVVTRPSKQMARLEALGTRVVPFDFRRGASDPPGECRSVWALARILRDEQPDVVHLITLKAMVLGGLATKLVGSSRVVLHLTGQGLLGISTGPLRRLYRKAALGVLVSLVNKKDAYLLVENSHDLATLRQAGAEPGPNFAILGGAGVDPNAFPCMPPPHNTVPVAAHVGRMVRSKGIDVLMQAFTALRNRGVPLQLELYGKSDLDNPEPVTDEVLTAWCTRPDAAWRGHVTNVANVWRRTDIFVLASRGGEGLPRALLEAAACGRPLVVTDVPGNRDFVRNGVEGFLVPPNDPARLAEALTRLASDADLRRRMGMAARQRVLSGYTESHVQHSLLEAYRSLLGTVHVRSSASSTVETGCALAGREALEKPSTVL
ncbi:MAG: glycosyltransferase family 4 protein [Hyphomicrobiaceae bacterium]